YSGERGNARRAKRVGWSAGGRRLTFFVPWDPFRTERDCGPHDVTGAGGTRPCHADPLGVRLRRSPGGRAAARACHATRGGGAGRRTGVVTVAAAVLAQDWSEVHARSAGWLVLSTLFGIPLGLLLLTRV